MAEEIAEGGKRVVRLERMLRRLKEHRFRLTPQRLAVVEILAQDRSHPSASEIYRKVLQRFPTTSLATVYKTLFLLKELGEVLELGFPDGSNHYDGVHPKPHPHVICLRCHKIHDPDLKGLDNLTDVVVRQTGFRILYHRLDFFGLCPACGKDATGQGKNESRSAVIQRILPSINPKKRKEKPHGRKKDLGGKDRQG